MRLHALPNIIMAPSAVVVLVSLTMFVSIVSAVDITAASFQCASQTTCSQCLRTPLCTWCPLANFSLPSRCFLSSPSHDALCADPANPAASVMVKLEPNMRVTQNDPLTKRRGMGKRPAGQPSSASKKKVTVQIQPQRVELKLPVGE